MKRNRLVKCKSSTPSSKNEFQLSPLDKSQLTLKRQTLYWPIAIGNTILFNIQPQVQGLLNHIPNEVLTEDQVNECKSAIYNIVNMESKGQVLPIPTITSRGKNPKREELYRILWKELEHFVSRLAVSPEHQSIISCLNEIHATTDSQEISAAKKAGHGENAEATVKIEDIPWKDLDRFNQTTDKERSEASAEPARKKTKVAATALESCFTNCRGQESLFALWTKKLSIEESQRVDFEGRKRFGAKAELYSHLKEKSAEAVGAGVGFATE